MVCRTLGLYGLPAVAGRPLAWWFATGCKKWLLSLPLPQTSQLTGARFRARTRSEVSEETIWQSDAALIFVKLRKMIASDTQPTDTILGTIAVAAHSLTGATGAAIAMPRDGVGGARCGQSGETAPDLGERLNVGFGNLRRMPAHRREPALR